MYRDQIVGASLLALSAIMIIVYAWLVFLSPWAQLAVQLTAFLAVAAVFGILGWVGYALATTPPPKPIEEIEAEVKKALEEAERQIESRRP
ncbi:MAG: transcriptional regulator [Thermoproteus sp.]|nr:transcriptional regulator [Thermoproteus sp.]